MCLCMFSVHFTCVSVCALNMCLCICTAYVLLCVQCTCVSVCALHMCFCVCSAHVFLCVQCTCVSLCSLHMFFSMCTAQSHVFMYVHCTFVSLYTIHVCCVHIYCTCVLYCAHYTLNMFLFVHTNYTLHMCVCYTESHVKNVFTHGIHSGASSFYDI